MTCTRVPGGPAAPSPASSSAAAWPTVLGVAFGWEWLVTGDRRRRSSGAAIGWLFISESFIRVTLPLSLPGVFAGSLLTFIPAIGDYVNAEMLGNPDTTMIGNVIQNKFLTQNDYPAASALSFMLMAGVLVVVAIYARILGTEEPRPARGALMAHATVTPAASAAPARRRAGRHPVRRQVAAGRLHAAGRHLPADAGRDHHPVQLQRPRRPVQLHWQGFTLKYWLNPFGVARPARGRGPQPRDRLPVDADRHGAGHARSPSPSSATGSAAGARSTR